MHVHRGIRGEACACAALLALQTTRKVLRTKLVGTTWHVHAYDVHAYKDALRPRTVVRTPPGAAAAAGLMLRCGCAGLKANAATVQAGIKQHFAALHDMLRTREDKMLAIVEVCVHMHACIHTYIFTYFCTYVCVCVCVSVCV